VEDRQHSAGPVAGRDHGIGLGGREGHHLVDDAVLPSLQGPDAQLGVAIVGRGDHNQVDDRIAECFVQMSKTPHVFSPQRNRLGPNRGIACDDTVERQPRLAPNERTMEETTCKPMSDHNCRQHRWFPAFWMPASPIVSPAAMEIS
jgi:hypothetical protein